MNDIFQSGLSGGRVMELLRRQFVVPTLTLAPTSDTLNWVDDMGYTNAFRVGELCRVPIDDGYTFYILKDIDDGVASWEYLSDIELLRKLFLNKDRSDFTNYLQRFLGGIEVGEAYDSMSDEGKGALINSNGDIQATSLELRKQMLIGKEGFAGGFTGFGGKIDEYANAELESLTLRRFLEVPELRFNRIEVKLGDKWNAPGAGIFEDVQPDYDVNGNILLTGTGWLKLEDGEYGAIAVGDICMGIFHSLDSSQNATEDYDSSDGIFKYAGFYTCYFTITEISGEDNKEFRYQMRPTSDAWSLTYHPSAAMTFVAYGSFTREDRQTSQYTTRTYTRLLVGQNTWNIGAANIAMQWGDLSNLAIHGINMQGYSAYLNNIYMTGVVKQINSAGHEIQVANDRGLYVSGTTYDYYDRVSYEGSLWLCIAENGTNTVPSKNDSAWLLQVDAGQSVTSRPNWNSSEVPYPASTILKFAERIWISNKETSAAPFPLYTDQNGNYYTAPDGSYYIVNETQSADWDLLLDASGLVDGEDGASVEVRYSANGTNWHYPYVSGDKWMQQRIGSNSEWGEAILFVGEDGAAGADGKYTDYQFAVNDSLTIQPTTGWQETPPSVGGGQYLWMRMRVVDPNTGTTTSWSVARIGGEEGTSVFKSTVFIRQNTQPDIPEGGSYASPIPTTEGWSDGIPEGEEILWASTRVFTHNGKSPQEDVWSTPRQMTDTADFDVEFSSVESPNPPSGHPNTNTQWGNVSDVTTIWMATSQKKNGEWEEWKVSKIKGEKGDMGVSITNHGAWKSGVTIPAMGVVTMGGSTYIAKVETTNPPLFCYTDNNGNYYLTPDGGYYLTGEANEGEYDLMITSGKDGADGKDYEWIYQVKATSDTPSKPTSVQQDDYIPSGWNDNPTGVSETIPYEFASFRTKKDGIWSEFSTPSIWAKFGKDGDSITINDNNTTYQVSNDGVNVPTGTWLPSIPEVAEGNFLWARVIVTYSDGNITTSYSVSRNGVNGTSISISDTSVTYAITTEATQPSDSEFTYTSIPAIGYGEYLWTKTIVTYSDRTSTKSYSVGRIGADGVDGLKGADSYLHMAYANSADGSEDFSLTYFENALYVGMYSDSNQVDSTDYTKYTWSRLRGERGEKGEKGDKGDRGDTGAIGYSGCVTRTWNDYISGQKYRNDANAAPEELEETGIRYLDVILAESTGNASGYEAYECIRTCQYSDPRAQEYNTDGISADGNWRTASNLATAFISKFIALDANIKFNANGQLVILDENNNICAGMTGSTADGNTVRFWVGGDDPNNAPVQIHEDGSGHLADRNISWDRDGNISVRSATMDDCIVNRSFALNFDGAFQDVNLFEGDIEIEMPRPENYYGRRVDIIWRPKTINDRAIFRISCSDDVGIEDGAYCFIDEFYWAKIPCYASYIEFTTSGELDTSKVGIYGILYEGNPCWVVERGYNTKILTY